MFENFSPDAYFYRLSPEQRAKSLRGHIVNQHLTIYALSLGIPNYDIEKCMDLGINLDWIVKKIMDRLKWNNDQFRIFKDEERNKFRGVQNKVARIDAVSRDSYRLLLIKTLLAIHYLGLSAVPWEQVIELYPNLDNVRLNFATDGLECSYYQEYGLKPSWYESGFEVTHTSEVISKEYVRYLHKQVEQEDEATTEDNEDLSRSFKKLALRKEIKIIDLLINSGNEFKQNPLFFGDRNINHLGHSLLNNETAYHHKLMKPFKSG